MKETILCKLSALVRKLGSRKFISEIIGILMGVYIIMNGNVEAGTALIGAVICGYNVAEAYIDAKSVSANPISVTATTSSKEIVERYLGLDKVVEDE